MQIIRENSPRQSFDEIDPEWTHIKSCLSWLRIQNTEESWSKFANLISTLTTVKNGTLGYLDARGFWSESIQLLNDVLGSKNAQLSETSRVSLNLKKIYFSIQCYKLENTSTVLQLIDDLPQDQLETEESKLLKSYTLVYYTIKQII